MFVPEGPDDGSQACNAWNVPSRSPSRRVRYDRLVRRGDGLGWWQSVAPQNHTVPCGTDHVCPLPGISSLAIVKVPTFVPFVIFCGNGLAFCLGFLREAQKINDLVRAVSCSASLVDNVLDGTDAAEGDGHKILELREP